LPNFLSSSHNKCHLKSSGFFFYGVRFSFRTCEALIICYTSGEHMYLYICVFFLTLCPAYPCCQVAC
jgi:hypothetical protein